MRGHGSQAGWNRRPHRRAGGSGEVDGLTSSKIFRHPLLQAELLAAGPSTRVTCATSIGASCGWSLLTDRAAHSDEHSRSQPHEQVMRQPDDDADFAPTLASASVTSNGRFGNYLHSLFFPLSPLRYLI